MPNEAIRQFHGTGQHELPKRFPLSAEWVAIIVSLLIAGGSMLVSTTWNASRWVSQEAMTKSIKEAISEHAKNPHPGTRAMLAAYAPSREEFARLVGKVEAQRALLQRLTRWMERVEGKLDQVLEHRRYRNHRRRTK